MGRTARRITAMMAILVAGCGGSTDRVTPISVFPRASANGPCGRNTARHWVHLELFEGGRGVLVPAGIGIRGGRRDGAYVTGGRCRALLYTEEPTGLIGVARNGLTLGDLYAVWGRRVPPRAVVHVDGDRWHGAPADVPLAPHAQIVVQDGGPRVTPHSSYRFPIGR